MIGMLLGLASDALSSGTTETGGPKPDEAEAVGTFGNELGAAGNFIAVDLAPALLKVPPPMTDGFLGPIPDNMDGPRLIVRVGFFRRPDSPKQDPESEASNAGQLSTLLCLFTGLAVKSLFTENVPDF